MPDDSPKQVPQLGEAFDQLLTDVEHAVVDTTKRTSSAPGTVLSDGVTTLALGGVEQMHADVAASREAVEDAIRGTDPATEQTLAGGMAHLAALPDLVDDIEQAGTDAVGTVNGARDAATDDVTSARDGAVSTVNTTRDGAVADVNAAAATFAGLTEAAHVATGAPVVPLLQSGDGRVVATLATATGAVDFLGGLGPVAAEGVARSVGFEKVDVPTGGPVPLHVSGDDRVPAVLNPNGSVDFPGGFGPGTMAFLNANISLPGGGGGYTGTDVFVLAGQSNAGRFYDDITQALTPESGGAFDWVSGAWVAMGATLGFHSAFAYHYVRAARRRVYIINVAISSTSITTWVPGQSSHTAAIATIAAALAALPPELTGARIAGVSWLQGESDLAMSQATYQGHLDALMSDFRTRYGRGLRWLIQPVGRAGGDMTNSAGPRAAQYATCANGDARNVLAAAGIEDFPERSLGHSSGVLHYNQTGYNIVGEMLASAAATSPNLNR